MTDAGRGSDRAGRRDAGRRPSAPPRAAPDPGMRQTLRRAISAAFRLRSAGPRPGAPQDRSWHDVRKRLLELPQMRAAGSGPPAAPDAACGLAPAGRRRRAGVPALAAGRLAGRLQVPAARLFRMWLAFRISAPDGHDWFVSAALLAFFGLGFLAAVASGGMPS